MIGVASAVSLVIGLLATSVVADSIVQLSFVHTAFESRGGVVSLHAGSLLDSALLNATGGWIDFSTLTGVMIVALSFLGLFGSVREWW